MTTVGGVGELELIKSIRPYLAAGAGDDDAALWPGTRTLSVLSTDLSVEGVHFELAWMSAHDAGWRALALALGDLAAKGAKPAWALTSVAVPRDWKLEDFTGLFAGMHALAQRVHLALIGGDLSATAGPAVISISVAGETDTAPVPRSAVRPGWTVGVTGPLGAAAVALRQRRALLLEPRLDEGARLNALGICCGDISDGLVREMQKFKAMAGVGSVIRAGDVPRAAGAGVTDALTSGEEAELVCVGPAAAIAAAGLVTVGEMVEGEDVKVVGAELEAGGYDHFA